MNRVVSCTQSYYARPPVVSVVTGVALLAIGATLLAFSGLPQPVPASMMGIGGIFLITPLLVKQNARPIKKEAEKLTVKITSQEGCALGRGLQFLPKHLTGIERVDGKPWQEPEEMIVPVEVSGYPKFTHLPLCLFSQEGVSFVYEGHRYDCVLDESEAISTLSYHPTCTLPRNLGNLDVSAFLNPLFSEKKEQFPDPRTLTQHITGTIKVQKENATFFQGELTLELMHGEGWDWRRPNEIFAFVEIRPTSSIWRLPLSFFVEEGNDLKPKQNGSKIRFYYRIAEDNVHKYELTLDQGTPFESVYFNLKIPKDLPDPRQQAIYKRHREQGEYAKTMGKMARLLPRRLKRPIIRPFVLPGQPYRGEVPCYCGKHELIHGNGCVALVALAEPTDDVIKWKSLTIPKDDFPRTWLLVVEADAKAQVTWKGNQFTLKVGNARGTSQAQASPSGKGGSGSGQSSGRGDR